MEKGELRVGIIGYGLAGRVFHAPVVAATPGLAVAAVSTSDPDRAAEAAARYPGVTVVASADELFDVRPALDLVVVATPNRHHARLALQAIDAGLPVVVDKPLTPDVASAEEIVSAAAAKAVPVTVFQNRRWDDDYLTIQRLVRDGELGQVTRLESRFERWRPMVRAGWRELPGADAGGLLLDLGSHLVDQALQLLGPATSVYAELDRRRPEAQVEDDVFIALTHANGARSHLWASHVVPVLGPRFRVLGLRGGVETYGLDPQEAALRDGGSPGTPGWGSDGRTARIGTPDGYREEALEPGDYSRFYAGVVAALRDGAPLPVDVAAAAHVVQVLDAARRSANSGTTVSV